MPRKYKTGDRIVTYSTAFAGKKNKHKGTVVKVLKNNVLFVEWDDTTCGTAHEMQCRRLRRSRPVVKVYISHKDLIRLTKSPTKSTKCFLTTYRVFEDDVLLVEDEC